MKLTSLVDYAKQYLEDHIVTGEILPGQQIKEEEIAQRLGISRPPIREAFKILEAEGLITRRPRRGVFVSEITERDVWEIYTLKMALYELATELAFDKLDGGAIQRLEKIVEEMEECVVGDPVDLGRYQGLNEQFHTIIIEISGHERLKKIVLSLHNQVKRLSYRSLNNPSHLKESCNYHRRILEAIKAKDRALAEQFTREHIIKGLDVLRKLLAREKTSTDQGG